MPGMAVSGQPWICTPSKGRGWLALPGPPSRWPGQQGSSQLSLRRQARVLGAPTLAWQPLHGALEVVQGLLLTKAAPCRPQQEQPHPAELGGLDGVGYSSPSALRASHAPPSLGNGQQCGLPLRPSCLGTGQGGLGTTQLPHGGRMAAEEAGSRSCDPGRPLPALGPIPHCRLQNLYPGGAALRGQRDEMVVFPGWWWW